MEAEKGIMERIERKEIRWLRNVERMEEETWLKQLYQWKSNRKWKRGWLKTCKTNITTGTSARGLDIQDKRLWKFGTGRRQQLKP